MLVYSDWFKILFRDNCKSEMGSHNTEYIFCVLTVSQLGVQDVQVQKSQNSLDFFPGIMLGSWWSNSL